MFQCRAKEKQGGTMWNTDKPTRSSRLLQTLETSQECSFSFIRFCVAQSINFFWALCGQWVLQRFMKKVALFADDKCYNFSWLTFTISNDSAICIHIICIKCLNKILWLTIAWYFIWWLGRNVNETNLCESSVSSQVYIINK